MLPVPFLAFLYGLQTICLMAGSYESSPDPVTEGMGGRVGIRLFQSLGIRPSQTPTPFIGYALFHPSSQFWSIMKTILY